jgi:hypothetical protein
VEALLVFCHLKVDPDNVYSPERDSVVKVENCLDIVVDIVLFYIKTYKEKMGTKYNPSAVRNGLLICVDPANLNSYSGSGITARGLVSGIGATLVNGIGFSSSNSGTFILDGTNDYINGDTTSFDLTGDLSAEVWFNLSATAGDWVRLIGKGDVSNRTFGFWYNNTEQCFLFQRYGTTNNVSSTYSITVQTNIWYHVLVTSNGSTHKLYLNGADVQTQTGSGPFLSSTSTLKVGYGEIHTYHNGRIGLYRIYNRALTAQEVLQNYNATKKRYV